MKLANLAIVCGLAACSGAPSNANSGSLAAPSAELEPKSPKSAVPATEPMLASTQVTAAASSVDQAELAAKSDPAAAVSCKFETLERFEGRTLKWEGECTEGKAHGKGALRAYPKAGSADKAVLIFFGVLERGEPKLGVIDTPDGFMAGEFAKGKLLDSEDPNVTIRAFKIASEAATLVSERLKAAGNVASASFYGKKALSLQQQMD